jgi:hypothetical protein
MTCLIWMIQPGNVGRYGVEQHDLRCAHRPILAPRRTDENACGWWSELVAERSRPPPRTLCRWRPAARLPLVATGDPLPASQDEIDFSQRTCVGNNLPELSPGRRVCIGLDPGLIPLSNSQLSGRQTHIWYLGYLHHLGRYPVSSPARAGADGAPRLAAHRTARSTTTHAADRG